MSYDSRECDVVKIGNNCDGATLLQTFRTLTIIQGFFPIKKILRSGRLTISSLNSSFPGSQYNLGRLHPIKSPHVTAPGVAPE